MHVDYRKLRDRRVVYALVAGVLVLLVAVLFSPQLNATRRWFFIAGISVQPSELSKLALVPFLAFFIDRRKDAVNTREVLLAGGDRDRPAGRSDPAAARPRNRRAAGAHRRA